jgi:cytochrome c553
VRRERPGRWAAALTAFFLSAAGAQAIEPHLPVCAGCHGADGNSRLPGVPSIAGQPRIFLENYLVLTREGVRGTEAMQKLLRGVSDREIAALAAHFEKLPARPVEGPLDRELFDRGRQVALQNRCGNCHLPDFRGQAQMPRLAGQREEFLAETMFAYRRNRRPGGDTIMAASLYGIADADIKALAHFLARSN